MIGHLLGNNVHIDHVPEVDLETETKGALMDALGDLVLEAEIDDHQDDPAHAHEKETEEGVPGHDHETVIDEKFLPPLGPVLVGVGNRLIIICTCVCSLSS